MRDRRDERGAILVLSTVGVVLAMIFSAMAIDLGFTAQEARRNQKVADLAALDAVRDLANHQTWPAPAPTPATSSPTAGGYTRRVAVRGTLATGVFVPTTPGEDVEVTVTSPHKDLFPFVAGAKQRHPAGGGDPQEQASFDLGSKLASLNPADATLHNRIFDAILGTDPGHQHDRRQLPGAGRGHRLPDRPGGGRRRPGHPRPAGHQQRRAAPAGHGVAQGPQNKAAGGDLAAWPPPPPWAPSPPTSRRTCTSTWATSSGSTPRPTRRRPAPR